MRKLTKKQKVFVDEYLIDLNATQAAIRAGYSKKTAKEIGHKQLTKVHIQNAIKEQMDLREQRNEITQDRVLLEIARLAFNDPRKAFTNNGDLKEIKDWPDEVAAAISSIKITETKLGNDTIIQLKEVKFWDKGKQLELAAKHLGMFTEKIIQVDGGKLSKEQRDKLNNELLRRSVS